MRNNKFSLHGLKLTIIKLFQLRLQLLKIRMPDRTDWQAVMPEILKEGKFLNDVQGKKISQ